MSPSMLMQPLFYPVNLYMLNVNLTVLSFVHLLFILLVLIIH